MSQSLDDRAVDRVLRRATALAGNDPLAPETTEPDHLVVAAGEVGIPVDAVQRSIAIEQFGPPPRQGRLDAVAGPAHVVDERVVPGSHDEILVRIDGVLTTGTLARRGSTAGPDREWVRRNDLAPAIRRARRVRASARPLGGSTTAVRVSIDRRRSRWAALAGGGIAGAATVLVLAASIVAPPLAVVALPVAAAGAIPLARSRVEAERVERELGSLLDVFDGGARRTVR